MMKTSSYYIEKLEKMIPLAKCELNYKKDYELLIATMLSAQTTDKKVNEVTDFLFTNYSLVELSMINLKELEDILKPIGTYKRKALYLKIIAQSLIENYNGIVPNNRDYIESLPGCGHKTCNVVLSNLFDVNCFAVDTHVSRVSKRLKLVNDDDSPITIEKKLVDFFKDFSLKDLHHRFVLFGRYICTAKKPKCEKCLFKNNCSNKKDC